VLPGLPDMVTIHRSVFRRPKWPLRKGKRSIPTPLSALRFQTLGGSNGVRSAVLLRPPTRGIGCGALSPSFRRHRINWPLWMTRMPKGLFPSGREEGNWKGLEQHG
jgi:hypothetical protein